MEAQQLHDWHLTPDQAKQVQRELVALVSRRNEVDDVRSLAGVDISAQDDRGLARAAVTVLCYPELELIETKVIEKEVAFPYRPGLLSFRESPLILSACEKLDSDPDLILVDGQGIAHPRRMGLASHLGLLLNKPTIGCAKSLLCGTHGMVGPQPGSRAEIVDKGEVIGVVLRTKSGVSPMYISIGHMVNLEAAIEWVLRCCSGGRLPEPTRLAHLAASGHLKATKPGDSKVQMRVNL